MEVLDAVYILEGKSKPLPVLGTDQLIDVERMNRLIAFPIATTVAKRLPASGEAGEKDISHNGHSCYRTATGQRPLCAIEPRCPAKVQPSALRETIANSTLNPMKP